MLNQDICQLVWLVGSVSLLCKKDISMCRWARTDVSVVNNANVTTVLLCLLPGPAMRILPK